MENNSIQITNEAIEELNVFVEFCNMHELTNVTTFTESGFQLEIDPVDKTATFTTPEKQYTWIGGVDSIDNDLTIFDIFRKWNQVLDTGECDDEVTIFIDIPDDLRLELQKAADVRGVSVDTFIRDAFIDLANRYATSTTETKS